MCSPIAAKGNFIFRSPKKKSLRSSSSFEDVLLDNSVQTLPASETMKGGIPFRRTFYFIINTSWIIYATFVVWFFLALPTFLYSINELGGLRAPTWLLEVCSTPKFPPAYELRQKNGQLQSKTQRNRKGFPFISVQYVFLYVFVLNILENSSIKWSDSHDRPFHNFGTSNTIGRRSWTTKKFQSADLEALKLWKGQSGKQTNCAKKCLCLLVIF